MSDPASTTREVLERGGSISRGSIVPHDSIDLPDGTEVRLKVEVIWRASEPRSSDNSAPAAMPQLPDKQIHEWALRNPAPQAWWDETANPFEPEQAPKPEPEAEAGPA